MRRYLSRIFEHFKKISFFFVESFFPKKEKKKFEDFLIQKQKKREKNILLFPVFLVFESTIFQDVLFFQNTFSKVYNKSDNNEEEFAVGLRVFV